MLGYYAQTGEERFEFEELGDALAHAREPEPRARVGRRAPLRRRNPQVVVEESSDGLDTFRVARQGNGQAAAGAVKIELRD